MAKPTKFAPHICIGLSILAGVGIIAGLILRNALIPMFLLLPTIIYEIYRTEGKSTKVSSILLLVVFLGELALIIFKISFNLAEYLGVTEKYIGGYNVPIGDIRLLGPTLMGILSVILFIRTYGVYTKWLAVIIFITSFAVVFILDPDIFQQLLKLGVEEGMQSIG